MVTAAGGGAGWTANDIRRSIASGLRYLALRQQRDGELPVCISNDRSMVVGMTPDSSVFPTALTLWCLADVAGGGAVREGAAAFLEGQRTHHGVWRHWTRSHPHAASLPPDVDDTSCAAAALARSGRAGATPRALILANRNRQGLFHTWFVPRPDRTLVGTCRVVLPQLRHPLALAMFFRLTSASPGDVDAVVNANALFALGEFAGRRKVVDHLTAVLRERRERDCDKWYDDPFLIWYFFARAVGAEADAAELILSRLASTDPESALQIAAATAARHYLGREPDTALVERLLAAQRADGSWPAASVYHGGRERRPDGSFAPQKGDVPHWGSPELTTAFALEALGRCETTRQA